MVAEQHWVEVFQQSFMPEVETALSQLFSAADAAVLKQAVQSKGNKEQNRYFEAAQSLRVVRFGIHDEFTRRLSGDAKNSEPDEAVDHDHIKSLTGLLSIRPDESKADTSLAAALQDLNARLLQSGINDGNTLSPEYFVESFLVSLANAEIDVHTKMLVLRMFEAQLYKKLELFIRCANKAFIEQGVLPQLETAPDDLMQSMQDIVEQTLGEATEGSALEAAIAELQVNDVERLYEIVEQQKLAQAWRGFAGVRDIVAELSAANLMPSELTSRDKMLMEKVPLVATFFELLTKNQNLPDIAKNMLMALQLPYTRIALDDESFFFKESHPARSLLREAVRLCELWNCDEEELAYDKLYKKLLPIVQHFIEAERTRKIPFLEFQFELLAHSETVRQKSVRASERLNDSEFGAHASEKARLEVEKLIDEKLAQQQLPFAASKLLHEAWSHVLYIQAMQNGAGSIQWQQSVEVVDKLLESFKPADSFENRSQLLLTLPVLLRSLREGLRSIDMGNDIIDGLFSELEQEHKALAITIGGAVEADLLGLLDEAKSKAEQELDKAHAAIDDGDSAREVIEPQTNIEEPAHDTSLLDKLHPGVSLIWHKDGNSLRCKLAAFIKHTGKYIITDRNGQKLAELVESDMLQKLQDKSFELIESGLVFDKTLESVIGGMRGEH